MPQAVKILMSDFSTLAEGFSSSDGTMLDILGQVSKWLEPRPLEQRRSTGRRVAQAGRHGIEQRPDGAAHGQDAGDDEDGDERHDQRLFDGVGAALVAKKRHDVVLINRQHAYLLR